jgi:hypothetical protein
MKRLLTYAIAFAALVSAAYAQQDFSGRKFEQLGTMLPTPNGYRTASGAPGHQYWQQKADYVMEIELRENDQTLHGYEQITYHNNSPDLLPYVWVQLDQNMRRKDSDTYSTANSEVSDNIGEWSLKRLVGHDFDFGFKILEVKDMKGNDLPYTINKTMMRIDLPVAIGSGERYSFAIRWYYKINDRMQVGGRSGMEYFEKDDNYLFTIAQFFPRMAVYDDINGWQNKQFLGSGEFALPFGDYDVKLTVPADHIVGSTGELQNPEEVLSQRQRQLFEQAKTADSPVIIVSQSEVEAKEMQKSKAKKVWHYKAENVRDFAFASSRKLIWDAMGVQIGDQNILAMSYYPKEGNPLWEQYSTRVVAQALRTYSKHTIDYPYPVAISVHTNRIGMEYPMICFNGGRPKEDGTYSDRTKHAMISVIIHEVGHNFFPMIINSDERQWTWMDEGLNTFVQYLTEQEWDPKYPSRRGPPKNIVPYMKGSKDFMVPIMTNSEQLKQFGSNAYAKPATALNILRETIMGPELFDHAFKTYAQRWAFKHPSPADFFRTMEDASAVDLDWFWRGWFYTTDHVDIEVSDVNWYQYGNKIQEEGDVDVSVGQKQQGATKSSDEKDGSTEAQTPGGKMRNPLPLTTSISTTEGLINPGDNFYEVKLKNEGGLVMPVILQFKYRDGSSEVRRIPAEIWRKNEVEISKVFVLEKEVEQIVLDPFSETADVNEANNYFPPQEVKTGFQQYKESKGE